MGKYFVLCCIIHNRNMIKWERLSERWREHIKGIENKVEIITARKQLKWWNTLFTSFVNISMPCQTAAVVLWYVRKKSHFAIVGKTKGAKKNIFVPSLIVKTPLIEYKLLKTQPANPGAVKVGLFFF